MQPALNFNLRRDPGAIRVGRPDLDDLPRTVRQRNAEDTADTEFRPENGFEASAAVGLAVPVQEGFNAVLFGRAEKILSEGDVLRV